MIFCFPILLLTLTYFFTDMNHCWSKNTGENWFSVWHQLMLLPLAHYKRNFLSDLYCLLEAFLFFFFFFFVNCKQWNKFVQCKSAILCQALGRTRSCQEIVLILACQNAYFKWPNVNWPSFAVKMGLSATLINLSSIWTVQKDSSNKTKHTSNSQQSYFVKHIWCATSTKMLLTSEVVISAWIVNLLDYECKQNKIIWA